MLLRHPKDEVNYCVYIIPGNPKLSNDDLSYWHHYMLEKDPNVSRAVGKSAKLERMKAGSLRIGGEPITYGNHVLLIGDAAGFVDPMTGEGIHTALDSGRIAARFLCEAIAVGNFDKEVMREYQNRWLKAFGNDFKWLVQSTLPQACSYTDVIYLSKHITSLFLFWCKHCGCAYRSIHLSLLHQYLVVYLCTHMVLGHTLLVFMHTHTHTHMNTHNLITRVHLQTYIKGHTFLTLTCTNFLLFVPSYL